MRRKSQDKRGPVDPKSKKCISLSFQSNKKRETTMKPIKNKNELLL